MRPSTSARRRLTLVAGALAAAFALSACGSDGSTSGGSGNTNFVTAKSGVSTVAKGERQSAPELSGQTVEGEKLDLGGPEYKGKVVVINVWGSWCAPCRAEAKYLKKVSEETKSKGVEFVGINSRDPNKDQALSFEKEFGIEYPSLYDPSGKLLLRFPKGYLSLQGIPSTLVIDRDGGIAARAVGGLNDKTLHEMIDPLAAEK